MDGGDGEGATDLLCHLPKVSALNKSFSAFCYYLSVSLACWGWWLRLACEGGLPGLASDPNWHWHFLPKVDTQTQEGEPGTPAQRSSVPAHSTQLAMPEIWSVRFLTNSNSFLSKNLQTVLILWQTTIIRNESSPEGMSSWSLSSFLMLWQLSNQRT